MTFIKDNFYYITYVDEPLSSSSWVSVSKYIGIDEDSYNKALVFEEIYVQGPNNDSTPSVYTPEQNFFKEDCFKVKHLGTTYDDYIAYLL